MYYEEEIRQGKLYYRNLPYGKWKLVCYEIVLDRLIGVKNELYEARIEIDNLKQLLKAYHAAYKES